MINIRFSGWFAPWFRSTYKELSVNLWKYVCGNDVTIQHGFNGACCDCNSLEYRNVDLIFMEYFWQEQALHLLFVLVRISLMFLGCVQMSIGNKT